MEGYRKNIVFSWVFLSLAAVIWVELNPDYFIWKIFAFLALIPRINNNEKDRLEIVHNNTSLFVKIGFVYMLGWLLYILLTYFKNPGSGDRILSDTQLIMFVAPIIAVFILSELRWYIACNERIKT